MALLNMILRYLDILSPPITLYFKGNSIHPSLFSGILSIISSFIIGAFAIYYIVQYINKEDKTIYYYNRYVEDAGIFPVNASMMFHFIQFIKTGNNKYEPIDFDYMRIVGLEETIDNYMDNYNLSKYDHWLYGPCNNTTDTKGISYLITQDYFEQAACIKKYYNSKQNKFYDNTDKDFKWPIIKHGCSNPKRTFYGILIEKCVNDSFRSDCKPIEDIENYLKHFSITFQLIDFFPDMISYKNPFLKYVLSLTNGIFIDSATINHLNFNPAISITHEGIFFDRPIEERAYIFTQNEKVVIDPKDTSIIVGFYFWMQNTMQYYERNYKKLQDLLSDIGGLGNLILDISFVINYLINDYVTLLDTEQSIFNSDKINFGQGNENQRPFIYAKVNEIMNSPPKKKYDINHQKSSLYNIFQKNRNVPLKIKNNEESKSDPIKNMLFAKKNQSYNDSNNSPILVDNDRIRTERGNKYIKKGLFKNKVIDSNIENFKKTFRESKAGKKDNDNDKNLEKRDFTLLNFIFYLISCKNGNLKISYFEKFRTQIISEENIIQNHLDIYKLLKVCNIERHNPFYLKNLENDLCC